MFNTFCLGVVLAAAAAAAAALAAAAAPAAALAAALPQLGSNRFVCLASPFLLDVVFTRCLVVF